MKARIVKSYGNIVVGQIVKVLSVQNWWGARYYEIAPCWFIRADGVEIVQQ